MDYNTATIGGSCWSFLRIRVAINVRLLLKRSKHVVIHGNQSFVVQLKYERLPIFGFLCGRLGHNKIFCNRLFEGASMAEQKGWGPWLRSMARQLGVEHNQWLRDSTGFSFVGEDVVCGAFPGTGKSLICVEDNSMLQSMDEDICV